MKTVINLDGALNPVCVTHFESNFDLDNLQGDWVLSPDGQIPDEILLSRYRLLDGEFKDVGNAPTKNHVWSVADSGWIDPRTLQDIKATKRAEINSAWGRKNAASFTFLDKEIDCSASSRSDIDRINGSVALNQAMPDNWVGAWKTSDNSLVPIPDVATWKLFYAAMVAQGQANYARAQELKAQIDAATTKEEVEAVVW